MIIEFFKKQKLTPVSSCLQISYEKVELLLCIYIFMHVKCQQMGFGFFIAAFSIPVFDMQLSARSTSSNNFVIICHKMFI